MRDSTPLRYAIDDQDRLISVNDAWSKEAERAATPGLASPGVLGRRLWHLINDPTIAQFFGLVFTRLRTGRISQVRYSFRCDTPTERRLLDLIIVPAPAHGLQFTASVLASQSRPAVALLDVLQPRSAGLLRMCSWCKRVPLPDGTWREIEEAAPVFDVLDRAPPPLISHGICPDCEDRMQAMLDDPAPRRTFGDWPQV